jgi:two-component system sensor histidine kinase CpxA
VRTLFAKILLWFLATTVITVAAVLVTSALTFNPERQPPFGMLMRMQMREARFAYEHGGRQELAETIERLRTVAQGEMILADANGRDLLTGEDRSGLIREAQRRRDYIPWLPFARRGNVVFGRPTPDGKFWFFVIAPDRRSLFWFIQPQHLWILGIVVLLCYALALHLTSPVRTLQRAVDRFGKGDLSARAPATRRDELGQLARTFNQMADRIQTLVTAERRLLMDISHELRSPLARLGVAIELARSDHESQTSLDRIQKEAERLATLVGELLEVTRAEGDPAHRKVERVNLGDLLREVVEDSRIEADAHRCTLKLDQHGGWALEGDPELLRRAVENVVRNAIRYSAAGGAVEVKLEGGGGAARITVRDYGPGVPEETLGLLFEPFYRVDSDRNRVSGGVGLGLSIARRAIQIHHGSIRAANANPGLRVEIELPAAVELAARSEETVTRRA